MADRKRSETVLLPQANPGNVELALQSVRVVKPQRPVSVEWLEDQGITQPKQAVFLLRFLGALDDSDCLCEPLAGCRLDANAYAELLRELAVAAYAEAGVGRRESLGWLGRDAISREEIKARLQGPFSGHDLKRGGHKNAFYCLCAIHELLRDRQWLRPVAENPCEARAEERKPGGEGDSPEVIHARLSDPAEVQKLLLRLTETPAIRPPSVDEKGIRVPFAFSEQGEVLAARIYFESPMRPGDYARLGRMLQKMGEAVEANV